jgi:hypothetical protein
MDKHNFFKALICAFFLSLWSYIPSGNFKLVIINFCVLFLGIFFLTSMYDLIINKLNKIKDGNIRTENKKSNKT